jgi:hypothetical protein
MQTNLSATHQQEYAHLLEWHGKDVAERYKNVILEWINDVNRSDNDDDGTLPRKGYFYQGKWRTSRELASMGDISQTTFLKRINSGLTIEEALAVPPEKRGRRVKKHG